MPERAPAEQNRHESVYRSFVAALTQRDLAEIGALTTDDVEVRSYSTAGALVRGREETLTAVDGNRHLIYTPSLHAFEHLGEGWMIVSARLRHTTDAGGMADSAKTLLARVEGARVSASLVFATPSEALAEHAARQAS
jgi:hypothetical protein